MAVGGSVVIDLVANKIAAEASKQKWYQKNANFVTTLGGLVATILVWVGTQPFADDPRVQTAVVIAGFVLTCLGVRVTPNGWSDSQLRKIGEFGQSVPTDVPMTQNTYGRHALPDVDEYALRKFGGE